MTACENHAAHRAGFVIQLHFDHRRADARNGARLAGFFFVCDQPKGPPFGILAAQLDELLQPNFELIEDKPVDDSIPVFAERERWQVWRRR